MELNKRLVMTKSEKHTLHNDGNQNNYSTLKSCDDVKQDSKTPSMSFRWYQRQDFLTWLLGIAFGGALIAAIFAIGIAQGWDAQSGYTHNTSATSQERFWSEPFTEEPGVSGRHGVDCESRWYYWKLPPPKATALTRLFVWTCYCLHQIAVWIFIYFAQAIKASEPSGVSKYSTRLHPFNWILFGVNVCFHLVHLLQTHTTYDATAQDVSIASSQSSVIMLLVFVVIIEYRDRGIFLGWPTVEHTGTWSRRLRFDLSAINLVRKYHGYAFAWAATYTFWYHPMENTLGHAMGFAHTWMILLQGSLIYTDFHLNKYWRLLLEVWVVAHGGLVAYQTGGPDLDGTKLWPMFAFGFGLVFVLTQIFSLPFWKKIHFAFRILPLLVYLGFTLWCYSWIPDAEGRPWVRLSEIIRIPGVYYLYGLFGWAITFVFLKIEKKVQGSERPSLGAVGKSFYLGLSILVYVMFVGLSTLIQILDLQISLIAAMIVLVGVFVFGVCVTHMLIKQAFIPVISVKKSDSQHNQKKM